MTKQFSRHLAGALRHVQTIGRLPRRAVLKAGAASLLLPALARRARAETVRPERVVSRRIGGEGALFAAGFDKGMVTSLHASGHEALGDFILQGGCLGQVRGKWRVAGGDGSWRAFDTATMTPARSAATRTGSETRYTLARGLALIVRFVLSGEGLRFDVDIENARGVAIEFGDLAVPLPVNELQASGGKDPAGLLKHSFVSGHGSHIFWQRKDVATPWLAMFPQPGTALEYWDTPRGKGTPFCVYFNAACAVEEVRKAGSRWRLPASIRSVPAGETLRQGAHFELVEGYDDMRRAIADHGLVDVEVIPGMTVPSDLEVTLSLGSRIPVARLDAEHPGETRIEAAGMRAGRQLYRVAFSRLGENQLTLVQTDGSRTTLEFFATEPVETLIAKRGAFIAAHQHNDPAKWYNGLLGEWAMDSEVLLGPDNYDRIKGWRIYEVTCDDPGLSKPAFLGLKLAEYPVQAEVDALDRYIAHFVWGGLQQTTEEPYPYGIYGILDWKRNRESDDPGDKGRKHLWRPYDYPHIVAMYFGMYRAARHHPGIATRMAPLDYLQRAFGTARAMFTVPDELVGWDAWNIGYYNEIVLTDLIEALDAEGLAAEAREIRSFWEKKVHHFVEEVEDLFVSEYAFDSTGFESTQAMARYAIDRPGQFPAPRAQAFRERQMQANLFCRGWLEPSYYYLGSDYRGQGGDAYVLTYMSQMGGWGVLDYALNDAEEAHGLLRLGHASALSSWALMNTGTPESNYGYWFGGKANDGGAGGGFEPAALGMTWLDQPHRHGSWYYSCEIDLGFCGGLRAAATTLVDDPLFGRVALGGTLETRALGTLAVVPRDGVRRRFHVRLDALGFDVQVGSGARLSGREPIMVDVEAATCSLTLEHGAGPAREIVLQARPHGKGRASVSLAAGAPLVENARGWIVPLAGDTTQTRLTLSFA